MEKTMLRSSLILLLAAGCLKTPEATTAAPEAAAPVVEETATPADGEWIHYGADFAAETTVAAKALLESPQDYLEGVIRVTDASITDVCQAKGCWLVIADGDKTMRIFTKDHAFVVAKDSGGSLCELEGSVVTKTVSAEFVAHLEAESTDTETMPEKGMAEGDLIYEFSASAIRIDGQRASGIPVGEAPSAPEVAAPEVEEAAAPATEEEAAVPETDAGE
jgi:hypothetical protein